MSRKTVKSQREVAAHFRVTPKTVGDWRTQGMPGDRGKYDLEAIREWKEARPQDGKNGRNAHSAPTLDMKVAKLEQEVRKLRAEASRAEKTNELIEGQFIDRHLVENFVSHLNQHIRNDYFGCRSRSNLRFLRNIEPSWLAK